MEYRKVSPEHELSNNMNGIIENQIRISSTQFNKLEEYCEVHGIAERYRQALDNLIRICKFPAQEYEDIEWE